MKLKRIFAVTLCLASAAVSVFAAGNFAKTKTYAEGTFSDLAQDKWYYNEVVSAYELGFMNGTSADKFSAEGNVTVAQGITLASRIHNIYNGGTGEFTQGDVWYQVYVDYAIENGFVKEGQFDSYTRNIKRIEMATLFADALPASEFAAKNNVTAIPDVSTADASYEKLLMLYNAGVVMGSNDYGDFYPNKDIKRSEASAIVNRVALAENRLSKVLLEKKADGNAVFYIDDKLAKESSWNYDNRFQLSNATGEKSISIIDEDSTEKFVNLNRAFSTQEAGLMGLDMQLALYKDGGGIYFKLTNKDGQDSLVLMSKDGYLYVGDKQIPVPFENCADGNVKLYIRANLDTDTANIHINGVDGGQFPMQNFAINKFEMGTTVEGTGSFVYEWLRLFGNYSVNEVFQTTPRKLLPLGWTFDGSFMVDPKGGMHGNDLNSVKILAQGPSKHSATKTFDAVSGNIIAETFILLPKGQSGAYVSIGGAGNTAVKVVTDGNTFKSGDGTELRKYTDNIWQLIRIEADTNTQTALIKIDGKKCATVNFENAVSAIDTITVGFDATQPAIMWFDDVMVTKYTEPADYVPVPVPVDSPDYIVGMTMCSLWREGSHLGWDKISAYPDVEPVLGYYEEGLAEVADWEIKFMLEHGIDYQHYCWYSYQNSGNTPIKKPFLNYSAIHDGYFNAKYSDMMKFTFMWENASGTKCTSFEQFRDYYWNYWKEYYFTDPRIMTMDGKLIFTVYQYKQFVETFGSPEKAKEAIEWMRKEVKDMGFEGLIILFQGGNNSYSYVGENLRNIGCDGAITYTWGSEGKNASHQIALMKGQIANGWDYSMPVITPGFNDVGWTGIRKGLITVDGYSEVADFIKNTQLKKFDADSWKSKAVLVGTWNEYGEGHYTMPCNDLNGFGYLDVIRKYFANNDQPHEDVVPTATQKARICNIYDTDRSVIEALDYELPSERDIPKTKIEQWDFSKATDYAKWLPMGLENVSNGNGAFQGTYKYKDGGIYLNDKLDVNATDAPFVYIRAKVNKASDIQIYFNTNQSSTDWSSKRLVTVPAEEIMVGQYADYYIDMSHKNSMWTDVITGIRVDIMTGKGGNFEISEIALMSPKGADHPRDLQINGLVHTPRFYPEDTGKEYYLACEPEKGIFSLLNLYHEFSRFSGRLYLANKNTEFLFTIGSNTVLVNGVEHKLERAVTMHDGLPVLPIIFMSEQMGYTCSEADDTLKISTASKKDLETIESRVENQWEWELLGDNEGWRNAAAVVEQGDGALKGISTNNDPNTYSPDLNLEAKRYNKLQIGMKYRYEGNTSSIQVFFKTVDEPRLDEPKSVKVGLKSSDSNGKYEHYEIDLTECDKWTGTVTQLRFDPFNAPGSFDIDYIRFIEDPDYVPETVVEEVPRQSSEPVLTDAIVNGTADDAKDLVFHSYNANNSIISVVKDPKDSQNNVFKVVAPQVKKGWVYIVQDVRFEPGKTYKAEFDILVEGTVDGNKNIPAASFSFNARYMDANGELEHTARIIKVSPADGWQHYEAEFTVGESFIRENDQFAIFADPVNELAVNYYIDNVKLTRE